MCVYLIKKRRMWYFLTIKDKEKKRLQETDRTKEAS